MKIRIHDAAHSGCARGQGHYRFSEHIEVPAFDGEHCVFCGQTFGTFVPQPEVKMGLFIYETPSPAKEGITRRHLVTYLHPHRGGEAYEGDIDTFIQETEQAGGEALVVVGEKIYLTQKYLREKYGFPQGSAHQDLLRAAAGRPAAARIGGFEVLGNIKPVQTRPARPARSSHVVEFTMPTTPSVVPEIGKRYRVHDVTQTTEIVTVRQVEPFGALCSDKKWRPLDPEHGCHWEEAS